MGILRIKFKKFIISYFFSTGILVHLFIVTGALLIPIVFQEPLIFFIERVTNTLAQSTHKQQQNLGNTLLTSGLINRWEKPSNPPPSLHPIDMWKGQGASKNIPETPAPHPPFSPDNKTHYVNSNKELLFALRKVHAGETILLLPGTYTFNGRSIPVNKAGTALAPITVKSNQLGLVKIKFNLLEGFHVSSPHWVFENLDIQGICSDDSHCEHAFHIVGKGHSFTLKNSILHDFNAQIKANATTISGKTYYPDNGLIEKNTFYNSKARQTSNPVTSLNIDSVNNWTVRGNLISDFSKAKGDHISYGTFMKGNGKNGIYENNLIICEMNLLPDRGIRIGLSLGGGGTGKAFCRNKNCDTEFTNGIIRNNIILNCSHDVGIYLNKAKRSQIYNNLIFNTLGIDVRFNTSTATIYNNIISGRIKERNGGSYIADNNIIDRNCISPTRDFSSCSFFPWFWDLSTADLSLIDGDKILGKSIKIKELEYDFCHNKRTSETDIGPIQYSNSEPCRPNNMQ